MSAKETSAKGTGEARKFGSFVLVGGLAAGVNWVSRILMSGQGLAFEIAVVIAYLFGMVTAYLLSRMFVFEKSGRSFGSEIWRFTLVNLVALVVVWVVSVSLESWILPAIGWTWRPAEVAHGIGILCPVFTSYVGHKHFTFGQKAPAPPSNDGASNSERV